MRTPFAHSVPALGLALGLALFLASTAIAASNPIPGVGIVVKRNPGSSTAFGAPGLPAIPADFFGPGSEPFAGTVGLQGQCSFACGGCDDDCDGTPSDSRIDYVEDTDSGLFATEMAPASLSSDAPIEVIVSGVPSLFHVFVEISGPAPGASIPGYLQLLPGVTLPLGTSAAVVLSTCDMHARFTFADAVTGIAVGTAIEADFTMLLQESSLPIARLNDGTPAGTIVLGLDGLTAVPFSYSSSGRALTVQMKSLAEAPVGVEGTSWGSLKSYFR